MPQQVYAKVRRRRPTADSTDQAEAQQCPSKIVELTDELLDEIDACLEENALEILRRFVQRGGQ